MSNERPRSAGYNDVEPHLFASVIQDGPDKRAREAVLAFAKRNGFSIAISAHEVSQPFLDTLDEASEAGVDVMLNTGRLDMYEDHEIVEDETKMDEMLEATCETVEHYREYFPDGRVFLWHEEPLFGNWSGSDRHSTAQSIVEYGPDIFEAQKDAVTAVAPSLDVGIFIHHPLLHDEERTARPAFSELMEILAKRDSLPDFTYCDFYRGYYEWEVGYESVNEYLTSMVSNVKEATRGRPVYYLGEAHSINNRYTPSKQAILGNLDTALAAGVDSYGWYLRTSFRRTHDRNYNPFLPNTGSVRDDQPHNSFTQSRDRLIWASLLLRDRVDPIPSDAIDLWVTAEDANFHEGRLEMRTADDEWSYLGEFSGYIDGDNPYSGGGRQSTTIIHGLDPSNLSMDGVLELRITGSEVGDGCVVTDVYAMPHAGPNHYRTEREATELVTSGAAESICVGRWGGSVEVGPGTRTEIDVSLTHTEGSAAALSSEERTHGVDRLRSETDTRRDQFDLWVYGSGIEVDAVQLGESNETAADACLVHDSTDRMTIYRGLDRETHFEWSKAGEFLDLHIETGEGRARAVHAMPAHGAANFVTAAEAAEIVESEYRDRHRQLDAFALGTATWPTGGTGAVDTWLHAIDREVREGYPYFDYHPRMDALQW